MEVRRFLLLVGFGGDKGVRNFNGLGGNFLLPENSEFSSAKQGFVSP